MGRNDDLRRMPEAKFAAKVPSPVRQDVRQSPVTKPPVTKPVSVTKLADVMKPNKGGRPAIGDRPMTAAERMRRYRARRRKARQKP
jgi:hypothetical protein